MFFRSLRIGLFLAVRYVRRTNVWSTLLIIFIMLLTFLNVVVVRGILVGLPEGARTSYEDQYSGQIIVTPASGKRVIEQTPYVLGVIENTEGYDKSAVRYISGGVLEANYKTNRPQSVLPDSVGVTVVGINLDKENALTKLESFIVEGSFLTDNDTQGILIGYQLLDRYAVVGGSDSGTVENVYPNDTVRLTIGDSRREYVVRGILKGKVGENSRRIFMIESEARRVMDRFDKSANEIAIHLIPGTDVDVYRDKLLASGLGEFATIQTSVEAQGKFLDDIKGTFSVLSNVIGAIGIAVATITVFIVIFIFAITRQKQIGILKGIGINRIAIESSYVFLSVFYAIIGIVLGIGVLYGFVQPYIAANPINFPFADGILVAPWNDTLWRSGLITLATLLAGYVPARLIVQKNTINAILGR